MIHLLILAVHLLATIAGPVVMPAAATHAGDRAAHNGDHGALAFLIGLAALGGDPQPFGDLT
jgi:hypothetical protein